jgi:hypothetical protein
MAVFPDFRFPGNLCGNCLDVNWIIIPQRAIPRKFKRHASDPVIKHLCIAILCIAILCIAILCIAIVALQSLHGVPQAIR